MVVGGAKEATGSRRDPKHVEVAPRYDLRKRRVRPALDRDVRTREVGEREQIHLAGQLSRHRVERTSRERRAGCFGLVLVSESVQGGERDLGARDPAEQNQLLRTSHRQLPEKQPVGEAEHRCRRPDTDCQRGHGGDRENRGPSEQARAEPRVLQECLDPAEGPHLSRLLTNGGHISEHPARLVRGLARIGALVDQLLPAQLDVLCDLVPQLVIETVAPGARQHPPEQQDLIP